MCLLLFEPTVTTLGFLCVAAGFLIVVALVVFVIKGKVALGESGAPNAVEWGKIKANLTSAIALFLLGAAMIALPFWRFQEEESLQQRERARQPATAILTGRVGGAKDVRLLLVVKPDYDQTYRGDIMWEVPLLPKKASYSVFYVDGNNIVGQQPFSLNATSPGATPQKVALPVFTVQTGDTSREEITPRLEVSNAELESHGLH